MKDNNTAYADMDIDDPIDNGESEQPQGSQPVKSDVQEENLKPTQEDDNGKATESDEPFHKDPNFKARLDEERAKGRKEAEESYKSDAEIFNDIKEAANEDPESALTLIKLLEKKGRLAAGSYNKARANYDEIVKKEEAQKAGKEEKKEIPVVEDDKLNNHPDIKFARELREKQQKEEQEKVKEVENFYQTFEAKETSSGKTVKEEIEATSNPVATRQRITLEAQALIEEAKADKRDLSFEDAMDEAREWVLHRKRLLDEYKEKGEIGAVIRSRQEAGSSPRGGSAGSSSGGSLKDEDRKNMRLMGIKDEKEYLKLQDSNSEYAKGQID
jgi:hypothetical protein